MADTAANLCFTTYTKKYIFIYRFEYINNSYDNEQTRINK